MNSRFSPIRGLRRSRGVSIVTAIFLLVVLSGLGVAIVTFNTAQQQAAAVDLVGTRAYEAARAGVEYGLYRQLVDNTCASANFTAPGTLAQMTVSVTCVQTSTAMSAGAQPLVQARITATACNQPVAGACPNNAPGVDYVQRVVQVEVAQ